jgi:hypothetical protein
MTTVGLSKAQTPSSAGVVMAPLKQVSSKSGSARSESNLRTAKYQPLPDINAAQQQQRNSPTPQQATTHRASQPAASAGGTKSTSFVAPPPTDLAKSASGGNIIVGTPDILQLPVKPEPFNLFLAILGHTYLVDEFRTQFKDFDAFYHSRKVRYKNAVEEENEVKSHISWCYLFFHVDHQNFLWLIWFYLLLLCFRLKGIHGLYGTGNGGTRHVECFG